MCASQHNRDTRLLAATQKHREWPHSDRLNTQSNAAVKRKRPQPQSTAATLRQSCFYGRKGKHTIPTDSALHLQSNCLLPMCRFFTGKQLKPTALASVGPLAVSVMTTLEQQWQRMGRVMWLEARIAILSHGAVPVSPCLSAATENLIYWASKPKNKVQTETQS